MTTDIKPYTERLDKHGHGAMLDEIDELRARVASQAARIAELEREVNAAIQAVRGLR